MQLAPSLSPAPALAPTPRDTVLRDGTAQLYHFRRADDAPADPGMPLLLVPSMINRWYVLDLREGASLATALVDAGLDTWCLDWGIPNDEDRYLEWDEVIDRLGRMVRRVKRETGAAKVGVLGYCMGGTLSAIWSALNPDDVAALVNLAGPIDFAEGGLLRDMVDPKWFDPYAVTAAGNVSPNQMQSGFVAMRPTAQLAKWVGYMDRAHKPEDRISFDALEAWASDNIPFPAAAYQRYIHDLYQDNQLVDGRHVVRGRRVDLGAIDCPVMTVVTSRDTICPPAAASALNERCGSVDKRIFTVPGGHVGAVVGKKATTVLYPELTEWLRSKLCS